MSRAMKDSGIPWMGEIPQDWEIISLGKLCRFKTGGTPPNKIGVNMESDGYPWITARDFSETYKFKNYSQYISKNTDYDYSLFPPKSILMVCIASVGKLGIAEEYVYSNQQITALIFDDKYNSLFYLYFIESISRKIIADASSNVVPIINSKYLNEIKCIVPSLEQQQAIAVFLDVKCAEVDELIALQGKMIDELKVYKQSVITEAVTKGLNPDAPLKDSGIEWIGQIPEHWVLCKLKNLFKTISGATPKTDYTPFWDGDIIWVTPADYKTEDRTISTGRRNITMEGVNSCGTTIVPAGSIIFSKRAPIGLVAINKAPLCTNQGCISCIPDKKSLAQFYYFLISVLKEQFELLGSGTTFKEISASSFESFNLIAPPIEEQQQIADYLDTKCADIDEMTSIKQKKIEQLKEYKKSIIYEYVTGKKQVNIE